MRGLPDSMVQDLKTGVLSRLLERVKADATLDLQIRDGYFNVYYRGGSLAKVREVGLSRYGFEFDTSYLDARAMPLDRTVVVDASETMEQWLGLVPILKDAIDLWIGRHNRPERDAEQRFFLENEDNATDYVVCDRQYAPGGDAQFDAIAVRWPSEAQVRKVTTGHRLAFVEIKSGDGSLDGPSGLLDHLAKAETLAGHPESLAHLKAEMVQVFRQKVDLGLLDFKPLEGFGDEKPELVFVLANHDPASTVLRRVLESLPAPRHVELRIAQSSFFGYRLHRERLMTVDEAIGALPA